MSKLELLIRKELKNFPGWRLVRYTGHCILSNGRRNVVCCGSPKNDQTVLKNMRQEISRIERGAR
jgi:hypothetical protein